MRESSVESYLKKQVKLAGGETRKVRWIGRANAPDELVMLNGATFVEVKRPGERPRPAQYREIDRLNAADIRATWVNCYEHVDELVNKLKGLR